MLKLHQHIRVQVLDVDTERSRISLGLVKRGVELIEYQQKNLVWEQTDSNRRPSACKADALNQLSYAPERDCKGKPIF